MLRGHEPIIIEEFNGLWKRGDQDSVPIDHFSDLNNIEFIESGFQTRPGIEPLVAKGNIVRMYNYKMQNGESLLALDSGGNIWHSLLDGSGTIYGPVLTIVEMEDFGFVSINGRAYITPFKTYTDINGTELQKGLETDFVYVYKGDGSNARKAAGFPPTNSDDAPMVAFNNPLAGVVEEGIRILACSFSDGADDSTSIGPSTLPTIYAPGNQCISLTNIPIGGVGITERRIWATHVIDPADWTANYADFTFYLVTTISNNTDTSAVLNFTDADLTTPFAAGSLPNPTSGGLEVRNVSTAGHCTIGLHVVGVIFETDTGYLTAPGPEVFGVQTFIDERKAITVSNIPTSPDSAVVKRHLVASKAVTNYSGNDHEYQLFFIPDATIEDNTTTELTVSFFDAELLDDASHLLDNFSEIPSGVTLTTYHGRMALSTTFADISLFYFSAPGEPEAIDQVDGVVIAPLEGNPLTNGMEYRDVFYMFKKVRTYAVSDNGDVPATWQVTVIDQGIGCSVHGVASVLDSGGVNVDFLIITDFSGLMIFNGLYQRPELTWKILDFWTELDRNFFSAIQTLNDSLTQILYMTLPSRRILIGDYKNGLNAKDIRWSVWTFEVETTTIALFNTNTLAIGSFIVLVPEATLLEPNITGPTSDDIVIYLLEFNTPVVGVTIDNLELVNDGVGDTPQITEVIPVTDSLYQVGLFTGTGEGDLQINLSSTTGISSKSTSAPLASTKQGRPIHISKLPPVGVSLNILDGTPIVNSLTGA